MTQNREFRSFYSSEAIRLVKLYESVPFEKIHRPWLHLIPQQPGLALDVGAGSGRDAAWLAASGWEVVAAEPATGMRSIAQRLHASPRIQWLDDSLPDLAAVRALDCRFDLILLTAVWMHVPPEEREQALRRLVDLSSPGGLLVFTVRHPPDFDRGMYEVEENELEHLGRDSLDLAIVPGGKMADTFGRFGVHWTFHAFRAPSHEDTD